MPHIKQYFHKQQKNKPHPKQTLLSVSWSPASSICDYWFILPVWATGYVYIEEDEKMGRKNGPGKSFQFHVSSFQFPHEIVEEMFLPPGVWVPSLRPAPPPLSPPSVSSGVNSLPHCCSQKPKNHCQLLTLSYVSDAVDCKTLWISCPQTYMYIKITWRTC